MIARSNKYSLSTNCKPMCAIWVGVSKWMSEPSRHSNSQHVHRKHKCDRGRLYSICSHKFIKHTGNIGVGTYLQRMPIGHLSTCNKSLTRIINQQWSTTVSVLNLLQATPINSICHLAAHQFFCQNSCQLFTTIIAIGRYEFPVADSPTLRISNMDVLWLGISDSPLLCNYSQNVRTKFVQSKGHQQSDLGNIFHAWLTVYSQKRV